MLRYILSLFARPRPYKCAPPLANPALLALHIDAASRPSAMR